MKKFLSSSLGWFRLVAFLEGTSYLFLLLVAMPLKYVYGMPEAVKYTGWFHGVFFVAYVAILAELAVGKKWSIGRSFLAFIASLLPAGTFVLDAKLLSRLHKEERA